MTQNIDQDDSSRSQTQPPDDSGDRDSGDMADQAEIEQKVDTQITSSNNQSRGNAKDPSRPRRKKARRACFACQRAHLTCGKFAFMNTRSYKPLFAPKVLIDQTTGDERPCQRCIKRGLQDACHDGVRKKAKYLHDAPNEALVSGVTQHPGSNFYPNVGLTGGHSLSPQGFPGHTTSSAQRRLPSFNPYSSQGRVPLSFSENSMERHVYSNQQSPISAQFSQGISPHDPSMQGMAGILQQSPQGAPFAPVFDPNDPNTYNFDPASYNFGNHYGALEFGMLGHMSSGAAETPPTDITPQLTQANEQGFTTPGTIPSDFSSSPINQQVYAFSMSLPPATEIVMHSTTGAPSSTVLSRGQNQVGLPRGSIPHAFTVRQPSNFSSPSMSRSQSVAPNYEGVDYTSPSLAQAHRQQRTPLDFTSTHPRSSKSVHSLHQTLKSPSEIYSHFSEPHSYTDGFHSLIAYLQKRFPPQLTLRIAKALASIRPSFISCTSNLTSEDLIFMEKQFQRCLYQYESSIERCGTPTLVLRRTGEIAAVGLEFSILTGWDREILLGWEKNQNVNYGQPQRLRRDSTSSSGYRPQFSSATPGATQPVIKLEEAAVGSFASNSVSVSTSATTSPHRSRAGGNPSTVANTPDSTSYPQSTPQHPTRPPRQPVFIPELLDDASAVQFYEDFALLAFGDSRGSVKRKGRLLRYIAREEDDAMRYRSTPDSNRGQAGLATTQTIECAYCWTVKRDVFEVPMVIVMNVSRLFDTNDTYRTCFKLIASSFFRLYDLLDCSIELTVHNYDAFTASDGVLPGSYTCH